MVYTAFTPVAPQAIFTALATGNHTVSIWVRGFAATCGLNNGNFGQDVWVEETA